MQHLIAPFTFIVNSICPLPFGKNSLQNLDLWANYYFAIKHKHPTSTFTFTNCQAVLLRTTRDMESQPCRHAHGRSSPARRTWRSCGPGRHTKRQGADFPMNGTSIPMAAVRRRRGSATNPHDSATTTSKNFNLRRFLCTTFILCICIYR